MFLNGTVYCLLCWGKGHTHIFKNTGSRLGKHHLLKGISHASQKPFLTDGSGSKRDALAHFQNLFHAAAEAQLPSRIVVCRSIVNKNLGYDLHPTAFKDTVLDNTHTHTHTHTHDTGLFSLKLQAHPWDGLEF